MQEKAEQGIWPTKTPLGYRNVDGPDGKRIIAVDPEVAPLVARLFERYATGTLSLKDAPARCARRGLSTVRAARRCRCAPSTGFCATASTPATSTGTAAPIRVGTSRSCPANCGSGCRTSSTAGTPRSIAALKHDFAFSGLIACGHCGCSVVGEIKKERYVYYHCTGYAEKCRGDQPCPPHVREEVLEAQFGDLLGRLTFDEEVLDWVREALRASHADEKREHEDAIGRLQAEHRRLQARLDAMYVDKLDGRVDAAFFDRMSAEWRAEQNRCLREIERHQTANKSYLDEGVQLLELARNAQRLFEKQEPREKRRLLNFVLSNCSWKDGEVAATFRQPFDLLAASHRGPGAPDGRR